MKTALLKVGLRQNALFVPAENRQAVGGPAASMAAFGFVAELAKLGFGVSEKLLRALQLTGPDFQTAAMAVLREQTGADKNWTPLVRGWDLPTGESVVDHIVTLFANIFQANGPRLACGHIVPEGTFPLERYNGCPFCGTPFHFGEIEKMGQGSKLKVLDLWTEADVAAFFNDLLASKTALDATQMDSLKLLLPELPMPAAAKIEMKETLVAVIDFLIETDRGDLAQAWLTGPTDILRYLWHKHTGFFQLVEPRTIVKRTRDNHRHIGRRFNPALDESASAKLQKAAALKLKFTRKQCAIAAAWLNRMALPAERACEMMHPKREIWVRFIRALRLTEFAKRPGFEPLARLLDVFYHEKYPVWQGQVDHFRLRADAESTMALLKERPGLFARSLFANMLWFGPEAVIAAFRQVVDKVPARLVFSLNMYADLYFEKSGQRAVKPLGGTAKQVPTNQLLEKYTEEQLEAMRGQVADLCLLAMQKRFAAIPNANRTMFIDPMLFKMPVAIGDRSETVQDLPSAMMGTRFPVEGDRVRLFMQWGNGLPAQHLDMDLSCSLVFEDGKTDFCSYSNLVTTGCKHSGDIQYIPEMVGTAEYIDLDLAELKAAEVKYAVFTCNAYSNGSLSPNLVVGWMDSRHPMHLSETTGVAFDPSCVQHQARIGQGLSKGLVFGVLDMAAGEIVWVEMPFGGQVVQNLDEKGVEALLEKLDSKLTIGALLAVKAAAQGLETVADEAGADERYTVQWAMNAAAVTQLLAG